jgi:hypothetical protein
MGTKVAFALAVMLLLTVIFIPPIHLQSLASDIARSYFFGHIQPPLSAEYKFNSSEQNCSSGDSFQSYNQQVVLAGSKSYKLYGVNVETVYGETYLTSSQ